MESNGYTHAKEAKLLPYGMTDFNRIMTANYYYVDKTMFIPQVERTTSFFFFVRPRRFGKSLFLNMLSQYYDRNKADQFEDLFGSLRLGVGTGVRSVTEKNIEEAVLLPPPSSTASTPM